ncbi:MAG: carboxymuconolactone decarboxylase family protein [Halieaceae bacterium]|jgi:alkylhydroperoxidase family enzyme|nr:carboxymuconolactone decarboxylase family protein [Halieaceae bacterium]
MTTKARVSPPDNPTGNIIRDSNLGLVPETLESYMALNRAVWEDGPLSAAEVEMARLRNARKVNCVFCKSVRYDLAIEAGLTEDKVSQINDQHPSSTLNSREKLILAYTDQYLGDPGAISDSLKNQLLATFTPQELVHLSIAVAVFNGFSRCAVALGGMPDELPIMQISIPQ